MNNIEIIVFDLDDTLLDTSKLLIPIANTSAFKKKINDLLPLMFGAQENLEYLAQKYHLILLTQGNADIQRSKVKALNIAHYFKEMQFVDITQNEKKESFFNSIKSRMKDNKNFLSIGNRLSTDIRPAKKNQAITCHFKYGEHADEKIEYKEDIADFTIFKHSELIPACKL